MENQVNQDDLTPVTAIDRKHGGSRAGAGRPSIESRILRDPRFLEARGISRMTAEVLLSHVVDEAKVWRRILTSEDDRVLLSAMMFLTSMRDGKPAQKINVTSQSITVTADSVSAAREIAAELRQSLRLQAPIAGNGSSEYQMDASGMSASHQSDNGEVMLSGGQGGRKGGR